MKLFAYSIFISAVLFTCSSRKKFDHGYFRIGVSKGTLDNTGIDEASGLVASVANAGMFWTHNDSGDEARIFLIDDRGRCRAIVYLDSMENRDWEDITIGPGPEKNTNYIYVGDIGDNAAKYPYKYLYRISEPAITSGEGLPPAELHIDKIDSIRFRLSDRPRDTEALMADPLTGDMYIISKREDKKVNVYKLPYPLQTNGISTATLLMQIPYTKIVAADMSADGKEMLIKNYQNVYYWTRGTNESIEAMLKKEPAHLPYASEPQGEAIAFDRTGAGYYTLSEEANKKKPHLMFYERK